jgi:hypothetical protein
LRFIPFFAARRRWWWLAQALCTSLTLLGVACGKAGGAQVEPTYIAQPTPDRTMDTVIRSTASPMAVRSPAPGVAKPGLPPTPDIPRPRGATAIPVAPKPAATAPSAPKLSATPTPAPRQAPAPAPTKAAAQPTLKTSLPALINPTTAAPSGGLVPAQTTPRPR